MTRMSRRCNSPAQQLAQSIPVEARTRIGLASGRDVGVADDVFNGIGTPQDADQPSQADVLDGSERLIVAPFELDTEREVVTAFSTTPSGYTRMPGTTNGRKELDQVTVAANEEVCRHPQRVYFAIVRMGIGVEAIGEQLLDAVTAKFARRQADCMDYQQLDRLTRRTIVMIGRWHDPSAGQPAIGG
jgi:hypothetical protein